MPSGYEKSPDYGGGQPPDYLYLACLVAFVAVVAFAAWLFREYLHGRL